MRLLAIFRLFYLIGAAFAMFFSILVFSKKNKATADKILGIWLIILFAQLFIPFLYLSNLEVYYRYAGYEIALYMFHPFLLYLYVKTTIGSMPKRGVIILNVVAIVISELFCMSFLMFPPKERLLFIEGKKLLPLFYLPLIILMTGYFFFNIYTGYKLLKNYKENVLQIYSYREDIDLLWMRRVVVLFGIICVLIFPMGMISYYVFHSLVFADYLFFVALVVFIFLIGYWGYQQGNIFSFNNIPGDIEDNTDERQQSHNDTGGDSRQYKEEAKLVTEIMEEKRPYLEPTLTILDLAQMVNMHPHLLSRVINREFHSNFFEYINNFRVEEFKQIAFNPEYKNLTILGIAMECGFNSKSAFNRIFKDTTGLTPGEFIRKHRP
jgi:AraC-like DNA-binding protein